MKALTIRDPWGSLILSGHKPVECRSRPTSYRGRIVIHSGVKPWKEPRAGWLDTFLRSAGVVRPEPVFSALLGTVQVVGCVPAEDADELPAGAARWLVPGYPCAWVLADPRPFPEPIPFRGGKLGLFDLPPGVLPDALPAAA